MHQTFRFGGGPLGAQKWPIRCRSAHFYLARALAALLVERRPGLF
jgi:hypothetical protein